MSLSDFEVIKQLGKGAFGSVSLVRRKKDSQTYAMKRIRLIPLSEKEREISLNEIRIIASLSHQNIISYKESFLDESSKTLNIVMEYADGGDIETKIKENKQKNLYFSENTIWFWLMQILEALLYLHQKKIIHRDIKGANIFLTKNNIVKIGDLGVSKVAKVGFAQTQTGTPYYCAPEIWRDKPYTDKCDVWSIGCLLYEICALRPPFRGTSLKDLCANVERGYYIDIPNIYSQDLRDVIKRMLVVNERERPSIEDLMNWDTLRKRRSYNPGNDNGKGNNSLIQTIRMPRNMRDVNMKLPKARYGEKEMMEGADFNQGKKNEGFIGNNNINNNGKIEEKKEAKQIKKYEYIRYNYPNVGGNVYGNYNPYVPSSQNQNIYNNGNKYVYPDYKNYPDRFNNNNNNNSKNNNDNRINNNNNNYHYFLNNNNQINSNRPVNPIINDRKKYAYLDKFDNNMKLKKEVKVDKPVVPNIGYKINEPYNNNPNNNNIPYYNNQQNNNIYKNYNYYKEPPKSDNYNYDRDQFKKDINYNNYRKEQPKNNYVNYKVEPKIEKYNYKNEDDLSKAVDEILGGINEYDEIKLVEKKIDPKNDSLWRGAYNVIENKGKEIQPSSEKQNKKDRYRDLFS